MEAFATYEDLVATPNPPEISKTEADELLMRASAYLRSVLPRHGVVINPDDEVQQINLCSVCCNLVRRSMSQGALEGLSSLSQAVGSTNVSVTWRDPDNSFFLSKSDRDVLGMGGGKIGWAKLGG